ncbi:hypothetical protein ACWNXI_04875 [Caldibacillus thermoamylovorans]
MANSFLDQAIQEKNIRKIRSAISSYIMADPLDRYGETEKAVRKVEMSGITIWEEHDGREFKHDRSQWNEEYFSLLQAQLMTNFSKERFRHTMEVGKELYKGELEAKTPDSTNYSKKINNPTNVKTKKHTKSSGKYITTGMVVVAAAAILYYLIKK